MSSAVATNQILDGTYRLVRCIGQGGMGTVWLADHLRLPKQVAIKVLAGAIADNAEAVARFRREAEIASRLAHPHIVDVLDFNALPDGTPYLVMELLRGESMRERLQRGKLPWSEVLVLVQQIASALTAAHDHGVVHRDLKPENVFLTLEPSTSGNLTRAKVLDFGISKIRDSRSVVTVEGAVLGTPQYMAPEQLSGQAQRVGPPTDQFALAAIVLELLSGEAAFAGETLAQVVYKVAYESPRALTATLPGALPLHIAPVLQRALAKDPVERFPSVSAFVAALAGAAPALAPAREGGDVALQATYAVAPSGPAALGSAPTLATPVPPIQAPPPPGSAAEAPSTAAALTGAPAAARRFPRAVTLGAAGAVAAGVAATLLLLPPGPRPASQAPRVDTPTRPLGRTPTPAAATRPPLAPAPRGDAGGAAPRSDAAAAAPARATAVLTPPDGAVDRGAPPRARVSPTSASAGEVALPAGVATDLASAKAALEQGDAPQALLLARRSLQERRTTQAFVILTKAYCLQRNLGLAVAMLRNVAPRQRHDTRSACRALGLELPP